MIWETRCCTPSLFSFVYGPVSTFLCIIWHQCYASVSNLKENRGIQNIWNQQQASYLVTSLLLTYASSFNVWDNMESLQWWFISSELIDQAFLNDWHVRNVNFNQTYYSWMKLLTNRIPFNFLKGDFFLNNMV